MLYEVITMIIAKVADVSLYLIMQGYTDKDELKFIREIYESDKLPNMSIVFNGIKRNKYGYGYHYDNSYYNEGPAESKFTWKQIASRL